MATRMQQRRGTADQWLTADPVLDVGEIGFETDTNSFKIGDGVNSWTLLDYFTNETGLAASLSDYVLSADLGVANGVATLDANGFVPATQLDIDLTGLATETYVGTAISNLVDSAPGTLDTLNELAAALGDDANFATTVTSSLAGKANSVDVDAELLLKKTEVVEAVSSNITMAAGYRYFVDTTVARTLTLPASPTLGDEIQIFDSTFNAGTNNITVGRNGKEINNTADDALLDVDGVAAVFVYTGSTSGWRMG